MKLIYYPDKILETTCESVAVFNTELHTLLDEMKTIMEQHNGLGLSANQVGVNKRAFILKSQKGEIYEMINPVLIEVDGFATMPEGCLSYPGIYINITRPAQVLFQYHNRDGELKQAMAEGIEARVFLHELEHLDGKSFLQKVNRTVRKEALSKLKKLKK